MRRNHFGALFLINFVMFSSGCLQTTSGSDAEAAADSNAGGGGSGADAGSGDADGGLEVDAGSTSDGGADADAGSTLACGWGFAETLGLVLRSG